MLWNTLLLAPFRVLPPCCLSLSPECLVSPFSKSRMIFPHFLQRPKVRLMSFKAPESFAWKAAPEKCLSWTRSWNSWWWKVHTADRRADSAHWQGPQQERDSCSVSPIHCLWALLGLFSNLEFWERCLWLEQAGRKESIFLKSLIQEKWKRLWLDIRET